MLAWAAPFVIFSLFFALHALLPAWRVPGYVKDEASGEPVRHRLNGLAVFLVALAVWASEVTGLAREWLWQERYWSILGASCFAALAAAYCVFREPADGQSALSAFLHGRRRSVVLFARVEVKMYLYIIGAGVLALNVLSAACYHYSLHGPAANPGIFLFAAMWFFFVVDYFCFERVQLYTYDLIHEKVGFKSFFGCFVVYPYLYLVPLWGLAEYPAPDLSSLASSLLLAFATLIFLLGWVISRGANLQKYTFKRWPKKKFLGVLQPRTLGEGERRLLCNGFWGIARHANYFGELVMAVAMAMALGYLLSPWAWVYCVFILALFVDRQKDDDVQCGLKYGDAWAEYKKQTPYRIVPGVY